MCGGYEFATELARQGVIAAAERKLARSLNAKERAGIAHVDSLLRLENYCRLFADTEYPPAQVRAELESLAKASKQK